VTRDSLGPEDFRGDAGAIAGLSWAIGGSLAVSKEGAKAVFRVTDVWWSG
jgi:hypothetical protein